MVVVLATERAGAAVQIVVAPVTHREPPPQSDAILMPANVKRDLGLDRDRSWIVIDEVNSFRWPGPDLRVVGDGTPYYGAIPDWLFADVRAGVGARAQRGKLKLTSRTE